jgi:drug/metabolite transporter (DMT)-like permease
LTSIVFVSFTKKGAKLKESSIVRIIFLGSGLIEIIIGYANKTVITGELQSVFTATSFLAAGTIGVIVFLIQVLRKKTKFHLKSVIAGFILGIPNFFSIYFIFVTLDSGYLEPSSIFGIMNISIVVLSFVIGILFFKEKVKTIHYIGVVMAIAAISLFMNY